MLWTQYEKGDNILIFLFFILILFLFQAPGFFPCINSKEFGWINWVCQGELPFLRQDLRRINRKEKIQNSAFPNRNEILKRVQSFKYYEVGFCGYFDSGDERFQNISVTNKRSEIYKICYLCFNQSIVFMAICRNIDTALLYRYWTVLYILNCKNLELEFHSEIRT